jgi:hypothetical protein
MIPSIDDRLASIIRSLTHVVLPSFGPEAGIAKEQVGMAVRHLQVIRAQLDSAPAYELEELHDARALASALLEVEGGGARTDAALTTLRDALRSDSPGDSPRELRVRLNCAIDHVIRASAADGSQAYREYLARTVLRLESVRTYKDRKWFALLGFDAQMQGDQ